MGQTRRETNPVCSEVGDGRNRINRGKHQSTCCAFPPQLSQNISHSTDDPADLRTYVGGRTGASGGVRRKGIPLVESGAEEGMGTASGVGRG